MKLVSNNLILPGDDIHLLDAFLVLVAEMTPNIDARLYEADGGSTVEVELTYRETADASDAPNDFLRVGFLAARLLIEYDIRQKK